jgi:hypothetical protein
VEEEEECLSQWWVRDTGTRGTNALGEVEREREDFFARELTGRAQQARAMVTVIEGQEQAGQLLP